MPLENRAYMQAGKPLPYWRANQRYLSALGLLLAANLFVLAGWGLGAGPLLEDHFLVSKENLSAGRVWTLLLAGVFHTDVVHGFSALLAVAVFGWALRAELTATALLLTYALATFGCSLALLVWPGQDALLTPTDTTASGTGFYVADGLLLTNAHVVGDAQTARLQDAAGITARVVATHPELDLALLRVQGQTPRVLPFAPDSLRAGAAVFVYGYGSYDEQNETLLVTRGSISTPRDHSERLVFDATIRPGNSGGPLLDAQGRWVGVATAIAWDRLGASTGLAVNGEDARAWIEAQGYTVPTAPGLATGELPPEEVEHAVTRLVVTQSAPPESRGVLPSYWLDPRVFGASGAAWALLVMAVLAWWRSPEPSSTRFTGVVAFLLFLFVLLDATGKLRWHMTPNDGALAHGYHVVGGLIGFVVWHLDLSGRLAGAGKRRRLARKAAARTAAVESRPDPGARLSAAEEQRMDALLRVVRSDGLESLSPDDRAFLDEASRRLKGD